MVYTCRSVSIAESLLWCIPVDQYLWLNLCYGSDQRILPVDASFLLSLDSPHDPVTLYSLSSPLEEIKFRVAKTFLNPSVQKSVHFQKKSVQSVQFSKNNLYNPYNFFFKNPYNPYIFLNQSVHFFKKSVQSAQFSKKIPFLKKTLKFNFSFIVFCVQFM